MNLEGEWDGEEPNPHVENENGDESEEEWAAPLMSIYNIVFEMLAILYEYKLEWS